MVEPVTDEVKRETLRAGVVDWVSIGEVYSLVAARAPSMSETELKSTTFDAVRALLHQGLTEIEHGNPIQPRIKSATPSLKPPSD